MEEEVWKDIPGWEGLYQASTLGRIRSLRYKRKVGEVGVLRPYPERTGYAHVNLITAGRKRTVKVHKLIAITFIPNPDGHKCINHIDEDKTNNRASNLEWCSVSYNNSYMGRAKRIGMRYMIPILQYSLGGTFIRRWNCAKDVERELGFQSSNIYQTCKLGYGHKSAYGYLWCYADDTERIKEIESLRAKESSPKLF